MLLLRSCIALVAPMLLRSCATTLHIYSLCCGEPQ